MFLTCSFPRAILHVDGDSFFASCEVALDPRLKGKPVVTGLERGIASAMTYEAKKRGVTRGMRLFEIRKICPDAIILPSDYETYSIFSHRMFNIVRRYTPEVEEYSIDECFADLTGLRGVLALSYPEITAKIKHDLESELGLTFSLGVAPTKVLAKIASKWKKPAGLTIIPGKDIERYLKELPIGKVWGIGGQSSVYLRKQGIQTAFDLASRSEPWVNETLSKPFREIWSELRGTAVYTIHPDEREERKSIQKTRTFTPPTANKEFIFSQLSKNIENACIKARRHDLAAAEISFFIKTQDFHYQGMELKLSMPVNLPQEVIRAVAAYFDRVYKPGILYRASGITLRKLLDASMVQADLFGQVSVLNSVARVYKEVDDLAHKYGKHTLFLGSSMQAMVGFQHEGARGTPAARKNFLLHGESKRRRLNIPMMGEVS